MYETTSMINLAKQKAVESLLGDADPRVRRLVIEELSNPSKDNRDIIEALKNSPCRETRNLIQAICSGGKDEPTVLAAHTLPVEMHGDSFDDWEHLEQFCWWLVQTEYSNFDPGDGRSILDDWADRIDDVSLGSASPRERIRRLQKVIYQQENLKGNLEDYYSPQNSYLNRVIERKRGIPISLSLIYIFVGRRLGWTVGGLNLPGHFLAVLEDVPFDPFFGGKILSPEEMSRRYFLPSSELSDLEGYRACPCEVAQRVLSNLYNCYSRNEDYIRLTRISEFLQSLSESA